VEKEIDRQWVSTTDVDKSMLTIMYAMQHSGSKKYVLDTLEEVSKEITELEGELVLLKYAQDRLHKLNSFQLPPLQDEEESPTDKLNRLLQQHHSHDTIQTTPTKKYNKCVRDSITPHQTPTMRSPAKKYINIDESESDSEESNISQVTRTLTYHISELMQ